MHMLLLLFFSNAGAVIDFEFPKYSINESDGMIKICVKLSPATTLERNATITVFTNDSTAKG